MLIAQLSLAMLLLASLWLGAYCLSKINKTPAKIPYLTRLVRRSRWKK
jgi:hypothetical protein